jgi:hypothetical protein
LVFGVAIHSKSLFLHHVSAEAKVAQKPRPKTRNDHAKMRTMRSQTGFESFLERWRTALRSQSDSWEGRRAVTELRSAGYETGSALLPEENRRISMFDFVLCKPSHGWRPRKMLRHILDEVKDYEKQKRIWKEKYCETEFFLAKIERTTLRHSKSVREEPLKQLLEKLAGQIEEQRRLVNNLRNPAQRSPLGVWEQLWANHARKTNITREIDLDTRLQLQIAKMFRTFLHKDEGVSLRTIARLVVLVYKVAGLANGNSEGEILNIANSPRTITTRSVEEILRRNRIDGQK